MQYNKFVALCLVALTLGQAVSLPQHPVYHPEQYPQQQVNARDERKFAEKPNAMKKVALDDLDDIGSNQLQVFIFIYLDVDHRFLKLNSVTFPGIPVK